MKRFGIRMDGCEEPIERLLQQHIHAFNSDIYTMVEVGSAGCVSLRAFRDIIAEARPAAPWRVIGIDLTPDKAWSLDMKEVAANGVTAIRDSELDVALVNEMTLYLLDDPRSFLYDSFPHPIDFAFIDGCHGACAGEDFKALEYKVRVGGLVMFHDAGELETGTDWQPHCQEFINVRSYIKRLGLMDDQRPGWRWVGEIPGSRHWGGSGNSCAVVQKIS